MAERLDAETGYRGRGSKVMENENVAPQRRGVAIAKSGVTPTTLPQKNARRPALQQLGGHPPASITVLTTYVGQVGGWQAPSLRPNC